MENILISACLLGVQCRYDGESKPIMQTVALMERYHLVPVCPEQLGGLPTPREPSERQGEAVVMKNGTDVTAQYRRGAEICFDSCNLCSFLLDLLWISFQQPIFQLILRGLVL